MNAMRAHIKKFLTINTSNIMRDESKVHDDFFIKTKTTTIKILHLRYVLDKYQPPSKKIRTNIDKNGFDIYITEQINELYIQNINDLNISNTN